MKESSTYQAILEEGRTEGLAKGQVQGAISEARKLLRLRGAEAFGPPDARITAALEQINDLGQLEELFKRVQNVGSWQELLHQPASGQRRGRRPSS